jgi:hypothetical protein
MTSIAVTSVAFQSENRAWLLSPHGTDPGTTPTVTLDVSKFTAGTHYPNGFIPSGTVLGLVTATGLYGPYDDAAVDGRATAKGLLFSTVTVINTANGQALVKVGSGMLVHGFVSKSKLPFQSGTGFADAAGIVDLPLIYWSV